ncbi:MAG: glycosyltransferase family 4 protein [Desulfobacterales bacterium]|jgi:glycosyltransferase involved in cell wall biosynthesis|nr:glycosyltransferase family 4 protein [Desulfobacterales bacterium]
MRPRIGLDARMVDIIETGLGRYARELARRLPALRPEWDFIVIKRPRLARVQLGEGPNVRETLLPGFLDHPRNLLAGPQLNRLGLDLYHALHHFLPLGLRVPRVVVTLHDLIWQEHARLTFDTPHSWLKWRLTHLYGCATMRHVLAGAHHIIAISRHTARRAQARYRWPAERMSVVHHGADHMPVNRTRDHADDSGEAYLFSLGNSKPYKNLRGLLRAFALVAPRHPGLRLKIAGRGDSYHRLQVFADRLRINAQVDFCGMVSNDELRRMLSGARALVFPSLIEGFGFPLVEAMALGCPVITSDIPIAREVAGDAAVFADPLRPDAIAAAIERVLKDARLRIRLRQVGLLRAQDFAWVDSAEQTAGVYGRLLASRGEGSIGLPGRTESDDT